MRDFKNSFRVPGTPLVCAVLRALLLISMMAGIALAQPDQTRITDTVFLAGGERFDGYIQFEWQSFVTPKAPIAPQSKLVRVVNGALDVTLAPTVNLGYTAFYRVRYFSHGRVRYTEFWDVPASSNTLTVAGVRLDRAPTFNPGTGTGVALPIAQADVAGLTDELEDRPVKGPNFFPSRTVFVNPNGALEAISGAPTDCVRVDGSAVPCGDTSSFLVDGEVPQGLISGINQVFSLTGTPVPPESLQVFRNGVLQRVGADYALSGNTIQFTIGAVPQPGDLLVAYYRTFQTTGSPFTGSGLLPQVLCSRTGNSTNALSFVGLGACTLGGSLLFPGDRLELHFDWALTGPVTDAYEVRVLWAGAPIYTRSFAAGDTIAAGSATVSIGDLTRQFSLQSYGALSPLQVNAGTLSVPSSAFQLEFQGRLANTAEARLTLTNFSVIRYPKVEGQ